MVDMFDNVDWDDLGVFDSMLEEFTEGEMERWISEKDFKKDNNEWQNESLDNFFEDDLN